MFHYRCLLAVDVEIRRRMSTALGFRNSLNYVEGPAQTVDAMAKSERAHRSSAGMDHPDQKTPRTTARRKACHKSWPVSRPLAGNPCCHCRGTKPGKHLPMARRGSRNRNHGSKPRLVPDAHSAEGTGRSSRTGQSCPPASAHLDARTKTRSLKTRVAESLRVRRKQTH